MDSLSLFAELTRDFCTVILQGSEMPLEDRAISVDSALARILAAGVALPIVPGEVQPDPASPFDEASWPGFGSFEPYWTVGSLVEPGAPIPCQMTQTLRFIFAQLWSGLESFEADETEKAAGNWGRGFEDTWGPAATELLLALHPHVRAYREDARRRVRRRRQTAQGLELVTPRPVELSPPRPDRPMLGVRFEPCPGGVAVLAVHPQGPAAGQLEAGDVVLSVDGVPLSELSFDDAGSELVGDVGRVRRYEIFRGGSTSIVEFAAVATLDVQ